MQTEQRLFGHGCHRQESPGYRSTVVANSGSITHVWSGEAVPLSGAVDKGRLRGS